MVLFNEIIEVLHLSQLTASGETSFSLKLVEGFGVRSIFVHVDHSWRARVRGCKRFEQEVPGGFCVSRRAEKEVKGISLRVNCSIQIDPFFFELDRDTAQCASYETPVSASPPSSREALPPPSPLRTVQASFPAYCSSLSSALCRTWLRYS